MEYRLLGTTGVRVSFLCLGTMTFGREADRAESAAIFGRCRDAGINLFDCANTYSQGEAEKILGELITGCRDEVVITTKAVSKIGEDVNAPRASTS
jgi:aryl-alcohol dehydrogenase-like predicted oxidoreductase